MNSSKFLLLVLISIVFSCQKEEKFSGSGDIMGTIIYDDGKIAKNANVFLNDQFRTTTDSKGVFEIEEVEAGNYKLKASSSDSTGYSETEIDIEVKKELTIEDIRLPVPVNLLDPTDISSKSIKLRWNKCTASDFREYKIYIHHSSALDENTGTLLHISTDINDTVLHVNAGDFWWAGTTLSPNTTYFFRVFVMNSFGRISGSNILQATTSLWDNADEFSSNYTIELESSFAAQGNLTGIDWDGNHFWMVYFEELGGFYDNNKLTLVQYDYSNGIMLDTIVFDDSNYSSLGAAWDGNQVWLSLGDYIQSVSMESETFGKSYHAGEVTVDLAWNNENLVLLDIWNKVLILNPVNGSILNQFVSPFVDVGYSGEKGVAARDNEIWIINNWHNEIAVCDNTGKHIGVVDVDFMQEKFASNYHKMPMCFMGDKLVIALDSQVRIYAIHKI